MTQVNPVYGIDLGTTYSAIGRYHPEGRQVEVARLGTESGRRLLRSAVFFPSDGQPVVGEAAMHAYSRHPDRVMVGIKRFMGKTYLTQPIDGKEYAPSEVAAEILRTLKQEGEAYFGDPIQDVIITVPAYFDMEQRRDTEKAAELAGLRVLRLLEEPAAAILGFSLEKIDEIAECSFIVYDLGGSTFDLNLVHCRRRKSGTGTFGVDVKVICQEEDSYLGGQNWNSIIQEIVVRSCWDKYRYDPREDAAEIVFLNEQIEKHKRDLGKLPEVTICADFQGHIVKVTRREFEEKSAGLLAKTGKMLEHVLTRAELPGPYLQTRFPDVLPLQRDQIDVLLCGGASRMPMVENLVRRQTGRPPIKPQDPEFLIVIGAAYAAHLFPWDPTAMGKNPPGTQREPEITPSQKRPVPERRRQAQPAKRPQDSTPVTDRPLVFISANSADYEYAKKLHNFLNTHGITTFFSKENLGSSQFIKEIIKALGEATHMIVVASSGKNVEDSGWVQFELHNFIGDIISGRKEGNILTMSVGNFARSELPIPLRNMQIIPMEALEEILRYVQ